MVERIENLPAGVLGFRLSGKVTATEYREGLVGPLHAALAGGEKLNLYIELGDDFGLDLGAMWEDVKTAGSIGLGHRSSWGRMALLTDKDWIRHGASAFGWLSPGELRLFEPEEQEAAKAWVAEGVGG